MIPHDLFKLSSFVSALAIASEATQVPAFTGTDTDAIKGSLD